MGEILLGAGLVLAGMVVLVTLIALGSVTLIVGIVAFFVGVLYMAGYGLTHDASAPHESWPLIVMVVGFALCILGGAADA
jgi:uncharacterized membrane protein HdeD (DUF308 family)